jgi:hypothetical protein
MNVQEMNTLSLTFGKALEAASGAGISFLTGQICGAIHLECHCQGTRAPPGISKAARERIGPGP